MSDMCSCNYDIISIEGLLIPLELFKTINELNENYSDSGLFTVQEEIERLNDKILEQNIYYKDALNTLKKCGANAHECMCFEVLSTIQKIYEWCKDMQNYIIKLNVDDALYKLMKTELEKVQQDFNYFVFLIYDCKASIHDCICCFADFIQILKNDRGTNIGSPILSDLEHIMKAYDTYQLCAGKIHSK
jgi:hypothetical protein